MTESLPVSTPVYRERLTPSPWVYVAALLIVPTVTILFMPLQLLWVGLGVGVALFLGLCVWMYLRSPNIIITDEVFQIGSAAIERKYLSDAQAFYEDDAFKERGQRLELESFYLFQLGISPVVKISNTDEADPVPYWLLSTRHPQRIANIINQKPSV